MFLNRPPLPIGELLRRSELPAEDYDEEAALGFLTHEQLQPLVQQHPTPRRRAWEREQPATA